MTRYVKSRATFGVKIQKCASCAIPQFVSFEGCACSKHICTMGKKVDKMIHICVMIKLMCVSPTHSFGAEDCTSYWSRQKMTSKLAFWPPLLCLSTRALRLSLTITSKFFAKLNSCGAVGQKSLITNKFSSSYIKHSVWKYRKMPHFCIYNFARVFRLFADVL